MLSRIDMLLREGVYVYLVFDGARLPMKVRTHTHLFLEWDFGCLNLVLLKAEKEAERARNRVHHLNEGKQVILRMIEW